jgi:stage II sporulation protein AB (anti-sigma F factor)
MEPNFLKMEIAAKPENVSFARVAVAAFTSQLDLTLNELDEIKVAVSEAVSNSIIHGYENNGNGVIQIEVKLNDEGLEIVIIDSGIGISNIDEALQPAFSTDPDRMGLGFVFMQSFMDDFHVESQPSKGTKIMMRKNLNGTVEQRAVQ